MILHIRTKKEEPNSRTEFQNRIDVIQILEFQVLSPERPETRSKSYDQCYARSTSNTRCSYIGKSQYFQVNILLIWAEPQQQCCSWSIGYMSISCRFIYSPKKIPGKRPTSLFVYHVPHALRATCAI